MNRSVKALLALSLMLLVTFAGAAQAKAPARQDGDAEIRKLIAAYYADWSKLSTDAPSKYYAKDADLIFFDIAPMKYTSWKEYSEGVQKYFFATASSATLTPNMNDLKITRRGNVAWTTVTFRLSIVPKAGDKQEIDARHTAIWERRGGHWLIVHEHVSVPLPG